MGKITSFRETGQRYTALRVIGFLCTLIGLILLPIGGGLLGYGIYVVASGDAAAAAPQPNPELFPGPEVIKVPTPWSLFARFPLLLSFYILFSGLHLISLGAFFRLMINMEENTRASAQMLDKLQSRLEASPERGEAMFRP